MSNAMTIIDALTLSPEAKEALRACIATRGRYKGFLSRTKPKYGTPAYAAHAAATLISNPIKAGTGTSLMASLGEHGAIYREIFDALNALPVNVSAWFDLDRVQLRRMGVY